MGEAYVNFTPMVDGIWGLSLIDYGTNQDKPRDPHNLRNPQRQPTVWIMNRVTYKV